MSTRFQIYCDYKNALKKADEIEKLSRQIRNLSDDDLRDESNRLNKFWTGQSKDVFGHKLHSTANDLDEVSAGLVKIASTIRDIAARNYNTEIRALELAERRAYK